MWETFGHSTPWHSFEKDDGLDVTAIDAAIRHDDGADTEEDDGLDNGQIRCIVDTSLKTVFVCLRVRILAGQR